MKNANDLFTGYNSSEFYHRYIIPGYFITDGVKAMADKCKCYWLLDIVLSYQLIPKIRSQEFQVWNLSRVAGSRFLVTGDDGNDNIFVRQHIPFSDFEHDAATIWLVNGILLLPSEY